MAARNDPVTNGTARSMRVLMWAVGLLMGINAMCLGWNAKMLVQHENRLATLEASQVVEQVKAIHVKVDKLSIQMAQVVVTVASLGRSG